MKAITILTDFGTIDGYVGEIKGVLASMAPDARVVDVTHDIAPGDVRGAAWALSRVWERFPPDTIHLVVVDPGVGSDRGAIVGRAADRWYVGPDNGTLTLVARRYEVEDVRRIDHEHGLTPMSDTFHGRDLFAPAAARLAAGVDPEQIGSAVDPARLQELAVPSPERQASHLRGHVMHVDRFGNLITNLPNEWMPARPRVEIAGRVIEGLAESYAERPEGALLLTLGSGGTLEISANMASAFALLGIERDAPLDVSSTGTE